LRYEERKKKEEKKKKRKAQTQIMKPIVQAKAIIKRRPKIAKICRFAVFSRRDFLMGVALRTENEKLDQ
jgi:hypothetical protein